MGLQCLCLYFGFPVNLHPSISVQLSFFFFIPPSSIPSVCTLFLLTSHLVSYLTLREVTACSNQHGASHCQLLLFSPVFPKPKAQNISPSRSATQSAKECHLSDCSKGLKRQVLWDEHLDCSSEEPEAVTKKPGNHSPHHIVMVYNNHRTCFQKYMKLLKANIRINATHEERCTPVGQKLNRKIWVKDSVVTSKVRVILH